MIKELQRKKIKIVLIFQNNVCFLNVIRTNVMEPMKAPNLDLDFKPSRSAATAVAAAAAAAAAAVAAATVAAAAETAARCRSW